MRSVLERLGLGEENAGAFDGEWRGGGAVIEKFSPIDGKLLARVRTASDEDYERAVTRAQEAFVKWRVTPGPVRGETVRQLGNALRDPAVASRLTNVTYDPVHKTPEELAQRLKSDYETIGKLFRQFNVGLD